MPYEMITRLRSRRGEKVAPFLTVENIVGIAVLAGPCFVLGDLPLFVRGILVVMGCVLGYLVTQESGGMLVCERVFWRLRGEARLLLVGRTITPDDLPGTRQVTIVHRAVARGGIVQKSRQQHTPAPAATAVGTAIVRRRIDPAQERRNANHSA